MRRRHIALLTLAAALLAPSAAAAEPLARPAATCSDYSNQADAQRAADTRDGDGDGIYCEDLPCPCLKPGSGHHPSHHHKRRHRTPALFHGRCKRDHLPDKHCTPGRAFHGVTAEDVCTPGSSATVRNVSEKTKRRVYKEYGIRRHRRGQYEIDHLIPLELGGSNSIKNLFAEAARPKPGFHQKDRLENRLHAEVCNGTTTLKDAQHQFKTNWLKAYRREFG